MKIQWPQFSDEFNTIYNIAKSLDHIEFKFYVQSGQKTDVYERLLIDFIPKKISPVGLLAYHNEHKAVEFLLSNGYKCSQALLGYALAGNIDFFAQNVFNPEWDDFYYSAVHLTYGGHFKQIFTLYDKYSSSHPLNATWVREGFIDGMGGTGILATTEKFLYWAATHIQFNDHVLFTELLQGLKSKNIIKHDLFPFKKVISELYHREGAHAFKAAITWPQLYVWLWQAPRLMKKRLPLAFFIQVASFLCFNDKDANFSATQMPFLKTRQLCLSSLGSLGTHKQGPKNELFERKEQRLAKRLLNTFSAVPSIPLFFATVSAEEKKQEERMADMRSRYQPSAHPLFADRRLAIIKRSDVEVLNTLKRCRTRLDTTGRFGFTGK